MVSGSEPRGAAGCPRVSGIFARNQRARWFGVAVAAVNLIAALTSIEAYSFWALVIVGIDVLVLGKPPWRSCAGIRIFAGISGRV
jgi:hypothetical protein